MNYTFGEKLEDLFMRVGTIRTIKVVGVVDFNKGKEMANLDEDFYVDGKGYVDLSTDTVWIYSDEPYPRTQGVHYPYFWFEGFKVGVSTVDEEMLQKMNIRNIQNMNQKAMIDLVTDDQEPSNEKIRELLSAGSSMVLPIIKVKDDALKKMVKAELREIMMSVSNLPVVDTQHQVANMRSALLNDTKMSVPYFHKWRELMDRDAFIVTANKTPDAKGSYHALIYTDSRDMIGHMPDEIYTEFLYLLPHCTDDERVRALALISPEEDENTKAVEILSVSEDDPDNLAEEFNSSEK